MIYLFALMGCLDNPPDPRQVFGFPDATDSDLLPEVEEAIEIANAALAPEERFVLQPTWKPDKSLGSLQRVPVYLLRRPIPTTDTSIATIEETLGTFRSGLSKTKLPPKLEDCAETDPCAAFVYAGVQMGRFAATIYNSSAAVDSASVEIDCRCVILLEDNLRAFKLIFGPSIPSTQDEDPVTPLAWYVPWYALHEVGHLNASFRLSPDSAWGDLYRRTLSGLSQKQEEEMRADAYAAWLLRRACFAQSRHVEQNIVTQACYGLTIQSTQLWLYEALDKSNDGIRRQYLDDGKKHPNTLLRLLAARLVMTDGRGKAAELLARFLDEREALARDAAAPLNTKR
ncbi:MAG: hypothetical protein JSR91_10125 [Proteobacteria bacterium]|nr:hypothetical protein [Pseudomonadota bacterium]